MSRSPRLAVALLGALSVGVAATSCGPDFGATVQIYLDTDAPVPGGEASGFPPALFDRVRIDVFPAGSNDPCATCSRVVALDHDALARGSVSFGVGVATDTAGVRIRATAYRSQSFPDGVPTVRGSLQVVVSLPSLKSGEAHDLTLNLPTDETGAPTTSLDQPRPIIEGRPDGKRVGTWPSAARTPCTGEAWPGQVCVPGGAFFMPFVFANNESAEGYDEQLVVLSPFFVDATETTVRSVLHSGLLTDPDDVLSWSGDEEGVELGGFFDWMTYSGNVERLDLPLVGMKATFASSYCQSGGADLPTEAQIAYLTSGTKGTRFPWGNDEPSCGDAWIARVAFDPALGHVQEERLECAGVGFEPFRPVGTSGRDRVVLDTGTIEDVVGNASELTRDRFTTNDDPCWQDGVVVDPFCDPADDVQAPRLLRAGSISDGLGGAVGLRVGLPDNIALAQVSFRCVRSGDDTTPPPLANDLVLGQGCRTTNDCGTSSGATCMDTAGTWGAGGIVGGYCTKPCHSTSDCGAQGKCGVGYCFLACDAQDPPIETIDDPLLVTKCHGRRDLICRRPDFAPNGACAGACTSDAECGKRYCDRYYGGCVDTKKVGAADGAKCTTDAQCRGVCVTGNSGGICCSACSAGGELDSDDCGGADKALCIASAGYESPGDLGYCYNACTKHSDCAMPNVFCVPAAIPTPDVAFPPWWDITPNVCFEAYPCSNLGGVCAQDMVCTETPYGNYCLSPDIPF